MHATSFGVVYETNLPSYAAILLLANVHIAGEVPQKQICTIKHTYFTQTLLSKLQSLFART